MLPAVAREGGATLNLRRHLASCSRCRDELATYEALVDRLGGLRSVTAEPPPGLLPALIAIPQRGPAERVRSHVEIHRRAYLGGAVAALVAAAGAFVVHQHVRRPAPA